jgi:hypothetical protein
MNRHRLIAASLTIVGIFITIMVILRLKDSLGSTNRDNDEATTKASSSISLGGTSSSSKAATRCMGLSPSQAGYPIVEGASSGTLQIYSFANRNLHFVTNSVEQAPVPSPDLLHSAFVVDNSDGNVSALYLVLNGTLQQRRIATIPIDLNNEKSFGLSSKHGRRIVKSFFSRSQRRHGE